MNDIRIHVYIPCTLYSSMASSGKAVCRALTPPSRAAPFNTKKSHTVTL